jgi:hypothetical protein
LGRVHVRVFITLKHLLQRCCLVTTRDQNHHLVCRKEHSWQKRDPVLVKLADVDRSGNVLAIFDQRLSREEARRVRVCTDAQVDAVELRQLTFSQPEKAHDLSPVARSRFVGALLGLDAMHITLCYPYGLN